MDKIENGKYSVLLRDDYLKELQKVRGSTERDVCIQNAFVEYLALPEGARYRETEKQTVHVTSAADVQRDYTMVLDIVYIPDEIVERLLPHSVYGEVGLDRNVNTALRLWLQARNVGNLRV